MNESFFGRTKKKAGRGGSTGRARTENREKSRRERFRNLEE